MLLLHVNIAKKKKIEFILKSKLVPVWDQSSSVIGRWEHSVVLGDNT